MRDRERKKDKRVEEERTKDNHSVTVSTGLDSDPKYRLTAAVYLRPSTFWNVR